MFNYPSVYDAANLASQNAQNLYLRLVKIEYGFIFALSIVFSSVFGENTDPILPIVLLIVLIAVTSLRAWLRLDRKWYAGRALAESIKTLSWQFAMRGADFSNRSKVSLAIADYKSALSETLASNNFAYKQLLGENVSENTLPISMLKTRALSLEERKEFYKVHRVEDQRNWYAKKSRKNKSDNRWAIGLTISLYVFAVLYLIVSKALLAVPIDLADPLVVLAAVLLGWIQLKRYGELAGSYWLTAHEIGIASAGLQQIDSELEFARAIEDIETVFSREHTQWVARRSQLDE
ncbi:DUF4231 domain-containing protein [Rhizobiaceae bacterium]|nr:DUF4231 domain-containing protein [Rhizobiaceae bacterium]